MPKNVALTDAGLKRLPLPATGTATYWDTTQKGFGVRVSPKGTRTFIALVGSGARHKIGRYPLISLATARDEARKLLAKKTLGTYEKPHTITWETAVEKYLTACEDKNRPRTISDYKKHLARFPFKGRRLTNIKKRDVAGVLEGITAKSMKAHVLTSAKAFFSWCADQGYIDASPISALKPPQQQGSAHLKQKAKKPKRSLSSAELKEVLGKALSYPYPFGAIVTLLILNGQRRQETASYQWEWITPDTITVPGEVTKNGLEHTFPYPLGGAPEARRPERHHTRPVRALPEGAVRELRPPGREGLFPVPEAGDQPQLVVRLLGCSRPAPEAHRSRERAITRT